MESEQTLMGYGELAQRWRAGAEIMATEIEGQGALARAQQKLELKQLGSSTERALLAYFRELKDVYKRFAPNDEVLVFDKFRGLKHYTYKNPYAFLLAYALQREGPLTKQGLRWAMNTVKETAVGNVEEADIIRYYRLVNKLE